jgi:hypothetical protein
MNLPGAENLQLSRSLNQRTIRGPDRPRLRSGTGNSPFLKSRQISTPNAVAIFSIVTNRSPLRRPASMSW